MIESTLRAGERNHVGPHNILAGARATTTASVLIQNYINTVLLQEDLSLPDVLPDLPKHQETARAHAKNWRDNLQPLLIQTNTDIVDFANSFDSYYDPLVRLAARIQHNPHDKASITSFKSGVEQLNDIVAKKHRATDNIVTSVTTFQTDLASDARNFGSDFDAAQSSLAGRDGQIAALQTEIEKIHGAMNTDLTMIGGGSTAAVVGGLMIAVGLLAEIETAGVSTALVVGGIAVVGTGAAVAVAGGVDYSKQSNALSAAIENLDKLQRQYAATKQVNHVVQGMADQSKSAVTATGSLLKGWQTLGKNLTEFEEALGRSNPKLGYFLIAQLDAAKKDWEDVAEQARKLENYGALKVTSSRISDDGTIDPHAAIAA